MYDIAIIGGGVVGCLIARELSRLPLKICLLEKSSDVSSGATKANSAIVHAGFDAAYGSKKAFFNVRGNALMESLCKELDVHFKRNGSLVIAFNDEQKQILHEIYERGIKNGVPELSIINSEEIYKLEPNLSDNLTGALWAKTGGIVCPYKLTHNAAENAAENGVEIFRSNEVLSIEKAENFVITTNKNKYTAKYIINAAGLFADEIAKMAGDNSLEITPRKGEYMIFDKRRGNILTRTIFQTPTKMGKGILVTPTVDGNLLIGPNAQDMEDKSDLSTTPNGLEEVFQEAAKSCPNISKRDIITSFSGLRAMDKSNEFVIGMSEIPNFINVAGIQSPGLTSAPAIAVYIKEMLMSLENLKEREDFNPIVEHKAVVAEISKEELMELVQKNPKYGKIICRCESVSEAEILNSIHSKFGAETIDGVKRRTRAGMGRCQGGFCMPKVLEILSHEMDINFTEINKNDKGSYILVGTTKGGSVC